MTFLATDIGGEGLLNAPQCLMLQLRHRPVVCDSDASIEKRAPRKWTDDIDAPGGGKRTRHRTTRDTEGRSTRDTEARTT